MFLFVFSFDLCFLNRNDLYCIPFLLRTCFVLSSAMYQQFNTNSLCVSTSMTVIYNLNIFIILSRFWFLTNLSICHP